MNPKFRNHEYSLSKMNEVNAVIIRKALAEDFEQIYPLLREFNNPYIDRDAYRLLFIDHWKNGEGYFGYVMIEDNQPVGFLGMIFSRRTIHNKTYRLCNMTSWIVKKEYRGKSLFLLLPVLQLKDYIITDFTASREVYALLKRANFIDFETQYRFIFPVFGLRQLWDRPKIISDNRQIERFLDGEQLKIFHDHLPFRCRHFLVQTKEESCYLVVSKLIRRKPPYLLAEVHYISNLSIFRRYIRNISLSLCLRLRVFTVYVDDRYLEGLRIFSSKKIRLEQPRIYRSNTVNFGSIDTLYSELILLNI